jgi:predicted anti-sigma-YlaC factor YlaD
MNHVTQDVLIDYLHGELPPGEDAMVLLHLESCTQCRQEYDVQASLTEAMRAYAHATETELPDDLRRSIWSAIDDAEAASFRSRLRRWLTPAAGLAAAAAAAYAILVTSGAQHGSPAIDAIYYLDDHAALTSTVPFNEGSVVPSSLVTGTATSDQQWLSSSGADDVADFSAQR